jgi:hypothetical protein
MGASEMPWTPNDAQRHTHKATTPTLQELWAKVANEALERTGDESRVPPRSGTRMKAGAFH